MEFLELIKSAKEMAWKQGLELNVNLRPIRKQYNSEKPNISNYKGDIAVDAQPYIDEIFRDFIPKEEQSSEDIVYIFFEKIRTEPKLFDKYQELKEKYGTKILNPGLARSVAEFLDLKNRGAKVLVEDKKCLIKSYTKIY
jgi:hypothetical protein